MPEISYIAAPAWLKTDPVGLGETHTIPQPRILAMDLMQKGLVTALFLECHSDDQTALNNALLRRGAADIAYEKQILESIDSWPMWPNPVHMSRVAAFAGRRGIPVHLIDKNMGNRSKIKATALDARDTHAANLFKQATAQLPGRRRGCLILYGSDHFKGGRMYGIYRCLGDLLNLYYVLNTPATLRCLIRS